MSRVLLTTVCDFLKQKDNFLILTHRSPDGDTLGSGYALMFALKSLGKKARVVCGDEIPTKYAYFTDAIKMDELDTKKTVIAVDVADIKLLGSIASEYEGKIELSIDHHKTNTNYAGISYVDDTRGANCEIIYEIIKMLGVEITVNIANALYTGLSTDTGCFKYSNTTPNTHMVAAELMKIGIDSSKIDRIMFETKSMQRINLEKAALNNLSVYEGGKIAICAISREEFEKTGCKDDDFEGITAISRAVEGVLIAATMRELKSGRVKVSIRSFEPVDAALFCKKLGGGGHARAAGCEIDGDIFKAKETILNLAKNVLKEI